MTKKAPIYETIGDGAAFQNGWLARKCGYSLNANPYHHETGEFIGWRNGWRVKARQEQYDFVRGLIANVEVSLLEKLNRVPEHWDGHELRQWIADAFNASAHMSRIMNAPRSRRMRAYKNDVLVNNL